MPDSLIDGTGSGFVVGVTSDNRLKTNTLIDGYIDSINPVRKDIEGLGVLTVGSISKVISFIGSTYTILISAGDLNLGRIYIGKSNVTANGSNAITFLGAGESFEIDYNDSSNILYVVGSIEDQEYVAGASL